MIYELAHLYHIGSQQQTKRSDKKRDVTKKQTGTYQTRLF